MTRGFSIIIPTFNRARWLRRALESVQRLHVPNDWPAEVVVIDNSSTDHTASVVTDAQSKASIPIRYVVEARQGASHSRNRGIEEAHFEHLIYLDDDMTVMPDWLEAYREAQEYLQLDCVVGPVEPEFEEPPEPWIPRSVVTLVTAPYSRRGDEPILLPTELAHQIPGCNFGVLRRAACEAGGFDVRIGPSAGNQIRGEDFDFGRKLVLLGKRVGYVPRCRIRHFIGRSKTTKEGLRLRWLGDGATARAFQALDGREPTSSFLIRRHLTMCKLMIRSIRMKLAGNRGEALRAELGARFWQGYLWRAPSLGRRNWPPRAIGSGTT